MMKKVIYLLVFLAQINAVYGQNKSISVDTVAKGPKVPIDKDKKWVGEMGRDNYIYAKTYPKVELHGYQPGDRSFGLIHYLKGAKQIELFVNLPKDSVKYYRYSIVADDYTSLAIDKMPESTTNRINFPKKQQVSLGKYNIDNTKLVVKLFKIDNKETALELCFYNKEIRKLEFTETTFVDPFNEGIDGRKELKDAIITARAGDIYLQMKGVDKDVPYQIALIRDYKNDKDTILREANFILSHFGKQEYSCMVYGSLSRGKYKLIVYPFLEKMNSKHASIVNFQINPPIFTANQLLFLGTILLVILIVVFGIMFFVVKKRNKMKLLKYSQQKDLAKTRLNSIRSQLNPHFMFNALAGIQNLMNTNKLDEANLYLGKFARLTRNVLDYKELISLAEEKNLLEDYLQMEQFRFGFTYEMNIDKNLNLDNVEIPSMLLQPFVENAVKHGISEKGSEGKIDVYFLSENKNLVLKVKDNGEGFITNKDYTGLGLQLSKNRIALLNSIHTETTFLLGIKSSTEGTEITITLNQWL